MRRLTGTEFGILALAVLFIIGGVILVVHPTEGVIFHPGVRSARSAWDEYVTKNGSQVYGVIAILLGLGFLWMLFYNRGK